MFYLKIIKMNVKMKKITAITNKNLIKKIISFTTQKDTDFQDQLIYELLKKKTSYIY